ncbi:MAG: serine/threonine-protein phosphatase, partial [Sinomicrobium sp.]|nr:serine/threonine-protein phosphatase [Sinomicrobium sp.]
AYGLKGLSAGACLEEANAALIQDNVSDLFVTVFYAILDLNTGELEYCCGGHNPPLLMGRDGSLTILNESQHIPLGIGEPHHFIPKKEDFEPGATLLLYTDGITEARNRDQQFFSEEGLLAFLKQHHTAPPRELVKGLIREVRTFSSGLPQSDDITLLAIRRQISA